MNPEAVLFDVDDTLCRYRRSGAELLAAAFERTGLDPFITLEEYHGRYPAFVEESDSVADLRERCFAAIAAEKGRDPTDGVRVAAAYADERDHGNVEPMAGLESALSAVDGLPLGVVTNGSPGMQSEKLAALGLADAFEVVVHAGYDAPAKPAPEPFEAALEALGVDPGRAVHVGNSLSSDVAGAKAAGVDALWLSGTEDGESAATNLDANADIDIDIDVGFDDVPDVEPDHRVSTLAELPATLGVE